MSTSFAAVAEGIRATIAAHAQAQDDGRTDDLSAFYHPDGSIEIPDFGTIEGAEALRQSFAGWAPRKPQRHSVVNTYVHGWNDVEAHAISDVIFAQKGEAGWAIQMVTRYHDTFALVAGVWLIQRRRMEFVN